MENRLHGYLKGLQNDLIFFSKVLSINCLVPKRYKVNIVFKFVKDNIIVLHEKSVSLLLKRSLKCLHCFPRLITLVI